MDSFMRWQWRGQDIHKTVYGMFIEEKQIPSNLQSIEGNVTSVPLDVL